MFSDERLFRQMAVRILQPAVDEIAFELKRRGRYPRRVEVLYDHETDEHFIHDHETDEALTMRYAADDHHFALLEALKIMLPRGQGD